MLSNTLVRRIHSNSILWQATSKSLLAALRKKTGFTFSNCKKALEVNENDLDKAEAWLREQAQQYGWAKAEKLKTRNTTQGLIAMTLNKTHGALVEINCETDFVARNKQFHGLADLIAASVLKHADNIPCDGLFNKVILDTDALKSLPAIDGRTIADHSALSIGTLGENINVRRALCMSVAPDVYLAGCTHPAPVESVPTSFGKYGALVAVKTQVDEEAIGKQLCQQIIGMKPLRIGNPQVEKTEKSDEETDLIHQEFLLDPDMTVKQLLEETGTQVFDFVRFEVGEFLEGQQNLDAVETAG